MKEDENYAHIIFDIFSFFIILDIFYFKYMCKHINTHNFHFFSFIVFLEKNTYS